MNRQILRMAGIISILVTNLAFGWTLQIQSLKENKIRPEEPRGARIDAKWRGAFCFNTDTFFLKPGEIKSVEAGQCDLKSVHVDYPWGEDWYNTTGKNPAMLHIETNNDTGKLKVSPGILKQ